jgi:anhydro-N-acetylmuramic acid kinase
LYAFSLFVFSRTKVDELIVSGGGAHNPLLMMALGAAFEQDFRIRESSELGLPGDAKEAFAFAVLAHETLHKRPANVPGATGAKKAVVLGKVCYAG